MSDDSDPRGLDPAVAFAAAPRARRSVTAIGVAVAAVIVLLFVAVLVASPTQRSSSMNFEIVGKVAPPIEGRTLDGDTFDLVSARGDWVVVNFFASWCVACRVEHPELVEFSRRHVDDGVRLIAVMFGDDEDDAAAFFAELGGSWPAIVEDTGRISIDYGVTAVPETVLISPSGRVVHKWIGGGGVTADAIDEVIGT